ncbi:MAG: hypothetical protein JSV25_01535 [Spirochaetota bacterium]|nr:MAG: hypothetical protein JSV25_01535 [Spirochaetota bacterium]
MEKVTIVIPTYWGRIREHLVSDEKIVFDHPTPLDEQGTLSRLLESLSILNGIEHFTIVIIAVANNRKIVSEVEQKVAKIISPFKSRYDITWVGNSTLKTLAGYLSRKGLSDNTLELLNLNNYASVRNICSLGGILNQSNYTVFIDDDEVFTDKDFLIKVDQNMRKAASDDKIDALAGYYLQPDSYFIDENKVPGWRQPYWNNTRYMNNAFEQIITPEPRLKPTPFVFGGNMTLSLEALKKVPFDPHITRGEDIDFLINLRIHGITFWLDRELAIKHLPPPSHQSSWKKVREDAKRFLYERKKIIDHPQITPEDFMPYPGVFLKDDLEERIVRTNELLMEEYRSKGDEVGVEECQKTISLVQNNPYRELDTRKWLRKLTSRWQRLTTLAEGIGSPE